MTIAAAWVRRTRNGAGQLVIAADSRLHGGGYFDASPKVFCLPRSDALLAFVGDAYFAYPLLLQVIQAVEAHGPLRSRAMDYRKFRTHLLRLLNSMIGSFTPLVPALSEPETAFLLGGYSWFWQEWEIDSLYYSTSDKEFIHHSIAHGPGHLGKILWAGDQASVGRERLRQLLIERYGTDVLDKKTGHPARFNWEPLQVVRDMLRTADKSDTIGGAPQIATVTQHLNSGYYGITWPTDEAPVHLRGRLLLPYERVDNWHLTCDTLRLCQPVIPPHQRRAARLSNEELKPPATRSSLVE